MTTTNLPLLFFLYIHILQTALVKRLLHDKLVEVQSYQVPRACLLKCRARMIIFIMQIETLNNCSLEILKEMGEECKAFSSA